MPVNQPKLPFRTVAILGAGVMGSQIAAHFANAGLSVHLLDVPAKKGNKNAIVEGAFKSALKLKPSPFVNKEATRRINWGNFEDHFERIAEAEWIVEAVIEKLDVKKQLMERIEATANPNAIISTNTSGLPIHQIAAGRSESFKKHFLGTHFFNPPRYLKLLEIIPTLQTDPAVLERIEWFGYLHLGKGVVFAKDTPNFIANRIGNYATLQAMRAFTDGDYTIEEVDALTGPLVGRPKSATFRTADVVGLDTLLSVADNLYQAIPDDESRQAHQPPELMRQLVENGAFGAKAGKGFYQKIGKEIRSVNPDTLEYEPPKTLNLTNLDAIRKSGGLETRIKTLYEDTGRAGAFTRQYLQDVLGYCARRVPEITDSPSAIDRAICWGFGWEIGPFEIWDILGVEPMAEDMRQSNIEVADWVEEMMASGAKTFYREKNGDREVYVPRQGYVSYHRPEDQIFLPVIKTEPKHILWEIKDAALLDLYDGVALYEFRSKANTIGNNVIQGLFEAIDYVEQNDYRGLVIGNEGRNFSVGANLGEIAAVLQEGRFDELEKAVKGFQDLIMRIRYARKPIVAAVQGVALGGACEVLLSCAQVVAATESYIGLVEVGAGLIPAGTGTTQMTARATERAASEAPSHIQPFVIQVFETLATARASSSAQEAKALLYLEPHARIIMNADRRIYVAKDEVLRLANAGYMPPPIRTAIRVLGEQGRAALDMAAYQMQQANYATEYDRFLAGKIAYIMTGGSITGPTQVHEDYLLELEREVFLSLLGEKKTQERMESILKTNKPLRN